MPVITSLEMHHRDQERVRLYLDDEYAMDLPLMEAARLERGQCLTDTEIAALGDAKAAQNAFDRALRFLTYRPRSTEEVRRHLVKKDVPTPLVADVIQRLEQRGYVDDVAFAEYWLSDRDRFKPMAPRALRYELRGKGVEDDIIDTLLSQVDEGDAAYRAAQGRISRYRGQTRRSFRHKLSGMLRRRGFGSDTINDVLLQLQRELDESEPGYFHSDEAD